VTKVSRVYTHWFNAGGSPSWFSSITLEPTPLQALPGTSVDVQFRATPNIDTGGCGVVQTTPLEDASNSFDAYGEYTDDGCASISVPSDWSSDPTSLTSLGYPYFQLRFTFIANAELNLEAEMDAFGFAYTTN
jgi:hypothetical protein